MERSKIPMLSKFDAISHIMPYFGQTHKAFFLLSSLCSETRYKLDEFYCAFVTCMKEYWKVNGINERNYKKFLFLPDDLFVFYIDDWDQSVSLSLLIKFLKKLRDSKGWYFNSHYMHSKIKIRDPIVVNIKSIKKLYAYVDIMKSTQVILCKRDDDASKVQYESSTLDTKSNHILIILNRTYINVHYGFLIWIEFSCLKIESQFLLIN